MKTTLTKLIVLAVMAVLSIPNLCSYIEEEQEALKLAISIVKRNAYKEVLKAESEGNIARSRYFRYVYNNPMTIIELVGPTEIIKKEKSRRAINSTTSKKQI